jgi:DNA-directed RNA polymerase specialized sigma24 family protein
VEQPEEFAAGIARLVLHEQWRRQLRVDEALQCVQREMETRQALDRTEEARQAEKLSALLDEAMARLAPEQRELIRRYYSAEGRTQIDARKRQAAELDVSINALRNRALRIRADIEGWARAQLKESS